MAMLGRMMTPDRKGSLHPKFKATVSRVWVDEQDAPEYMEMILRLSDTFAVRGRLRSKHSRVEREEHPAADTPCVVEGPLYFAGPAQDCTVTNVTISSLQPAQDVAKVPTTPEFTISSGETDQVEETRAVIGFEEFDEYESARYRQKVSVSYKEEATGRLIEGKPFDGSGIMHSLDHFELLRSAHALPPATLQSEPT